MWLETKSIKTEDANLVAGWQPHVIPLSEKQDEWSDTDMDLPQDWLLVRVA
jgi:hypothetical protein